MLSSKYQKEQIELEQQITNLREELSKMEQDMIGAEKWIELIKEYSVPKELTAPLLNADAHINRYQDNLKVLPLTNYLKSFSSQKY